MLVNGEKLVENYNVKRLNPLKEETLNVNVSNKVEYLIDRFEKIGCNDAQKCYFFFKKCFLHMREDTIWDIYENAAHNPAIESPIKYFIGACRNQMR